MAAAGTPKFLIDECCRGSLISELRLLGYDVAAVSEIAPSIKDADVLELSRRLERVIVTDDKDFGDLIVRQQQAVPGLILIRTSHDDGRRQAWLSCMQD